LKLLALSTRTDHGWCLALKEHYLSYLSDREKDFLDSVLKRGRPLSPKQREVVTAMREK